MNRQVFLIFLLFFTCFTGYSQPHILQDRLSKISEIKVISKINPNFSEYYEVIITQPLDHSKFSKDKFQQHVYIGFQSFNSPVILETEGYALGSNYSNELVKEFKANHIVVEHRFFGKSCPDTLNWNLLTVKQAAADYHLIKTLLDTIFTGKWISTGVSKGGQAALAYKMFYPRDVSSTVVYGTAVKNKQTVNSDSLLSNLSQTSCGKKIMEFQLFSFRNKKVLLPVFSKYNFDLKPDAEIIFDYLLLELPFSFWQNGNNCKTVPDTTASDSVIVNYIISIVPPRFYSSANQKRLEPSFYMFYHELGYYEYTTEPLKKWLKQNNYSNSYFTPSNSTIQFDNTYQKTLIDFLKTPEAETIFFIYGQNDPWALQTMVKKNVFIVPSGSHRSRIENLVNEEKISLYNKIKTCMKAEIHR